MQTYTTPTLGGVNVLNNTEIFNKVLEWDSDYQQLPIFWTPDGGSREVTDAGQLLLDFFPLGEHVYLCYPSDLTLNQDQINDISGLVSLNTIPREFPETSTVYQEAFYDNTDFFINATLQHTPNTNSYSCAGYVQSGSDLQTAPNILGTASAYLGSSDLDYISVNFILTTDNVGIAVAVNIESYRTQRYGVDGRATRLSVGAQTPLSVYKDLINLAKPTNIQTGEPVLDPSKGGVNGPANGVPPTEVSPGGSGNGGNSGTPGAPGKGGTSQQAGGQTPGSMDQPDDDQPVSAKPQVVSSGLSHLYTIYLANIDGMENFQQQFWLTSTQQALQQQYTNNPMDVIIDFFRFPIPYINDMVPCKVMLGNFALVDHLGQQVTMSVPPDEIIDIDLGNVVVREKFHGFLDYNPHTQIKLYVPYIGFVDIDPQDVMSPVETDDDIPSSVNLSYRVSLLTGDFTATLRKHKNTALDRILYQWTGNMATKVPLTQAMRNLTASTTWKNWATGSEPLDWQDFFMKTAQNIEYQPKQLLGTTMSILSKIFEDTTPQNIGKSKSLNVSRSGSLAGNIGELGERKPFFLVRRPNPNVPANFGAYEGYMSNIYVEQLSGLSGFTKVQDIHLDGITATVEELQEISDLLHKGVIL